MSYLCTELIGFGEKVIKLCTLHSKKGAVWFRQQVEEVSKHTERCETGS